MRSLAELTLGALAAVVVLVGLSFWSAVPVAAQTGPEHIRSFTSSISIDASHAAVDVTEVIVYDFGYSSRHGIERYIPTTFAFDPPRGSRYDDGLDRSRITPLTGISVQTASDTPGQLKVQNSGDFEVLRIGDPDRTITGVHTYRISYRLEGVFNRFDDHDELNLNVTGDGWNVPIDSVRAVVTAPRAIEQLTCFQGERGSQLPCDKSSSDGATAQFATNSLGANEGMTVVLALPEGTIPDVSPILRDRSTVHNAVSPGGGGGALAGVVGVGGLAGVGFLLWTRGRDRRFAGSAVDAAFGNATGGEERVPILQRDGHPVEFVPPDGIRPGHMGTLWDEVAHPLDVSAMMVDLAVRGWMRIEEIEPPKAGVFGIGRQDGDYRFVRLKSDTTGLLGGEVKLLDNLFRDGEEVALSDLRQHFAERLKLVEGALYDDVVAAGWFPTRPDRVRKRWAARGVALTVLGVGVTVLTFLFAVRFTLVGVAVVVVGVALGILSPRFASRTAKGSALLGRIRGFKEMFDVGEGERQAFAEAKGLFSKYLPYAIVFGMAEKWAKTFEALGLSPEEMGVGSWYVSPYGYNALTFGMAMNSFATTTIGSMAMAAPSSSAASGFSGFGGGGFSGGGFGGGGGGSW